MSTTDLPMPLVTPGRSSATRGGVCTEKPLGTVASGSASSMRTTSAPACWVLVMDLIEFSASATIGAAQASTKAASRLRHWGMV